jgi:tryptophanyl-tRNA synthetase
MDHIDDRGKVTGNIREVTLDYLGVGIDPALTNIFVQSKVPELAELTGYLSMLTSVAQLRANPTIKAEAKLVGVDAAKDNIIYGFLGYPISQAADILLILGELVPAGADQRPHIEFAAQTARRFNQKFGKVFPEPALLLSNTPRLPGLSGSAKMSKSLGNAVYLSDPQEVLVDKVKGATTDPNKARRNDPGDPGVCRVYAYHQAFDQDGHEEVATACRSGAIGCMDCKLRLCRTLDAVLAPIRERRHQAAQDPAYVSDVLQTGTAKIRAIGQETMRHVHEAVGYDHDALFNTAQQEKT